MARGFEGWEQAFVVPFANAEEAWFWTMRALAARHDGERGRGAGVQRPCDPDDVVQCVDTLYRTRRLTLRHAAVLGDWGKRQCPPPRHCPANDDRTLWLEALALLEGVLKRKRIVVRKESIPNCPFDKAISKSGYCAKF